MTALAPAGVSLHFNRMVARGTPGDAGQAEGADRMMVDNIDLSVEMLALVKPDVIALAHTATSYGLGREREAQLLARLETASGTRVSTAFAAVLQALERLGVRKLALAAPYSRETTLQGKAQPRRTGSRSSASRCSKGSRTSMTRPPSVPIASRARPTATQPKRCSHRQRSADAAGARCAEQDLGKPVLSSNAAMTWAALRTAGVREAISGYGRLLTLA